MSTSNRTQAGVTLLELMVALVVLSILAAIAYPSYEGSLRKARRSEAREALSDFAARQEQFFLDNVTYTSNIATLGRSATTENGYYVITIPTATTTTYTLRATAQSPQNQDTPCAVMNLTSVGARTPIDCW